MAKTGITLYQANQDYFLTRSLRNGNRIDLDQLPWSHNIPLYRFISCTAWIRSISLPRYAGTTEASGTLKRDKNSNHYTTDIDRMIPESASSFFRHRAPI